MIKMQTCPYCGATVPDGAIACGKCGASLVSSQPQTTTTFQSQSNSSDQSSASSSTSWSGGNYDSELSTRLQKAMRRNELLSYAIVALIIVLFVLLLTGL